MVLLETAAPASLVLLMGYHSLLLVYSLVKLSVPYSYRLPTLLFSIRPSPARLRRHSSLRAPARCLNLTMTCKKPLTCFLRLKLPIAFLALFLFQTSRFLSLSSLSIFRIAVSELCATLRSLTPHTFFNFVDDEHPTLSAHPPPALFARRPLKLFFPLRQLCSDRFGSLPLGMDFSLLDLALSGSSRPVLLFLVRTAPLFSWPGPLSPLFRLLVLP